jgi:hypothetical protein
MKQLMRRRVNMYERSLQKQLAHILSKGGNAAALLVSPYQVAVAKDKEAD